MVLLRLIFVCLAMASVARAEPLAGADDPGFRAAFTRLLTYDDPAALTQLQGLAEQGHASARLALTLDWVQGGAVAPGDLGYKPLELWQDGATSPDPRDQLDRALWLYELGEAGKADVLLWAWFDQRGEAGALPEGLVDMGAGPLITARILLQHLMRGDRKALAPLQYLLDRDRIDGWMVVAELNDRLPVTAGPPIHANLTLQANAATRTAEGRSTLRLLRGQGGAAANTADLQFTPLRALCAAQCGAEAPACEATLLGQIGDPTALIARSAPFHALIAEADFFATLRGAQILLAGLSPPDGPACLSRAIDRAKKPFPAAP